MLNSLVANVSYGLCGLVPVFIVEEMLKYVFIESNIQICTFAFILSRHFDFEL